MSIKAIFLDLDGTSLTPAHTFSEPLMKTLKILQNEGIEIIFSTGRSYASSHRFALELGDCRYIINYNGARVFDFLENRVISQHTLPAKTVFDVLDFERAHALDTVFYHDDIIYNRGGQQHASFYENETYIDTDSIANWDTMTFTKALFIVPPEKSILYQDKAHAHFERVNIMTSASNYLEIMPEGVSKATGVEAVLERINVSPDEAMAVGDQLNDLAMLNLVGTSFIMENATPQLKEQFDSSRIIPSNAEDGVHQMLTRYFDL